mgnify:CR=1 FL=1
MLRRRAAAGLLLSPHTRSAPALTPRADEQRAAVKGLKERSLQNKARREEKREMEEAQVRATS